MPTCAGCGYAYSDSFKFCPQCGRPKPDEPKIVLDVKVSGVAHDFDCPMCGDASGVQKVSAIVGGGTHETHGASTSSGSGQVYSEATGERIANSYTSSTVSSYNKSQTVLAQKLTLPDPPEKPTESQFEAPGCWGWVAGILGVIGATAILWKIEPYNDLWDGIGSGFLACGIWLLLATIIGGGAGFLGMSIGNSMNDSKEKFTTAMGIYNNELLIYQQAKAQWDELYYCHKHDVVFTPKIRQAVVVDHAIEACYRWGKTQ
ncbi:hypothetical protein SDC9_92021 [bioreactor metagenome]|uniref:Uncharacterized protein n=1 Tax=bioreactor metagenome TaxID=1076179 RepID=A0A645A6E6_9ZZZZ